MALHILELERDDLIEEVADVVGVATFLNESENGHIIFV
jgi:peroxiredoxin family protein